jgi:primosomal protein N' (replication factor Y) (superfamily II helicase)
MRPPKTNLPHHADLLNEPRGGRVPVLLPFPFAGPFDYRVPRDLDPRPGDIVMVPLNRREEIGVVWDGEPDNAVGDNRLRAVISILDVPPMRADIRRLVDWIAAYTITPPGEVLTMALRLSAYRPEPVPIS